MTETSCRLRVRGIVQGVGFRPYVWRLASSLGLSGWVRNDANGVEIALSGEAGCLAEFQSRLPLEAPPLARIDEVLRQTSKERHEGGIRILESAGGELRTVIGPDAAVCANCLNEIFDPANRRYRYAFTTCTHCGPRYTIAQRLPYDRNNTSLAAFALCGRCGMEYGDPADRRFHAEATCCADCGPRLSLCAMDRQALAGDPVTETLRLLRAGAIVAIKGLGGFHLACNARDAAAVERLRERKAREAKPFAVMTTSLSVLSNDICVAGDDGPWWSHPAAPVVLRDKTSACDAAFPGVAPGVGALGVMRPNTPLQWLIFHEAAGRPTGTAWIDTTPPDLVLVMTSANPQGEPLVMDDGEAFERLAGIADAVLGHDRTIVARADDSVLRHGVFIRRGRGFAPQAIRLPQAGPSVLAFGGWFKNTVAVSRDDQVFVSTHIGDLDNAAACGFLDETVERMLALTEIAPQLVAHDLHPEFYSTQAARAFAQARGLKMIGVQHHHAHLASVAAEQGVAGPLMGLALDGVGLGLDGGAWGGELLRIEGPQVQRVGHLAPLALPGGDRAAREPWRMGAAALFALGRGNEIATRYASQPGAPMIVQMLERRLNCPTTSSAGRWFDAAAGLLGVCSVARYEAEAAMRLEALADEWGPPSPASILRDAWHVYEEELDCWPLLAALANETNVARGAALFHDTFAAALADWASWALAAQGPEFRELAVAGGCALNRRLMGGLRTGLHQRGIRMLEARAVPPGDGGLSLGQVWVAVAGQASPFQ